MALFPVSGNPASSTNSNVRLPLNKLPSGYIFAIASYTVKDSVSSKQEDQPDGSAKLLEVLGANDLKTGVRPSAEGFMKTIKDFEEKKEALYDVVWIKEIKDEARNEMHLTLTVHIVGPSKLLHHHDDINDEMMGLPCTNKLEWDHCRTWALTRVAEKLAALDKVHQNGR